MYDTYNGYNSQIALSDLGTTAQLNLDGFATPPLLRACVRHSSDLHNVD